MKEQNEIKWKNMLCYVMILLRPYWMGIFLTEQLAIAPLEGENVEESDQHTAVHCKSSHFWGPGEVDEIFTCWHVLKITEQSRMTWFIKALCFYFAIIMIINIMPCKDVKNIAPLVIYCKNNKMQSYLDKSWAQWLSTLIQPNVLKICKEIYHPWPQLWTWNYHSWSYRLIFDSIGNLPTHRIKNMWRGLILWTLSVPQATST